MRAVTYPVVVDLPQGFVADGALEDDSLESVALVTRHQFHTHHLPFSHGHVTEHLCGMADMLDILVIRISQPSSNHHVYITAWGYISAATAVELVNLCYDGFLDTRAHASLKCNILGKILCTINKR